MNVVDFKELLKHCDSDEALIELCRRTVLHGTPAVFMNREDDFYSFRKRIADEFCVNFHEIYIVGSAKLGFSPIKDYKQFDLNSDIDVSIVSRRLFDEYLDKIRYFQMEYRASRKSITKAELELYHMFLEYTAIGWMRPDKLPLSFQIGELRSSWFDFFKSLSYGNSEVGNYKVAAGVFKDYRHLELYTISGIKRARESISVGIQ